MGYINHNIKGEGSVMYNYWEKVNVFRIEHGLEATDNKIIAIIHMMNAHGLDRAQAMAQTSLDIGDHGIDAWHYVEQAGQLTIYSSCLTRETSDPVRGLDALRKSFPLLEDAIMNGRFIVPSHHSPCLYNLMKLINDEKERIWNIRFEVISPFHQSEIPCQQVVSDFVEYLRRSELNRIEKIQLSYGFEKYNMKAVISKIKEYELERGEISRVSLDERTYLELMFIPLYKLVELYRQLGDQLFEKNVRLSLKGHKKAKDKLVTPMENTLEKIARGDLKAEIFTFYHGGVTISVEHLIGENGIIKLEVPNVINGCQTITIANAFLAEIERTNSKEKLVRFRNINVIAKIVVAVPENDLREITNANNRHNSIDNWQLYSNSSIHIEIELVLRKRGIFYERQEGKYETQKDSNSFQKEFGNTNKTYISVQYLGQIIALCKRKLNWAAKKAEIFTRTEHHDLIYDETIPGKADDIIFMFNLLKALDRAMKNYLDKPAYSDSVSRIFERPMVQANINYLGCLYYYQKNNKKNWRQNYHIKLNAKASSNLVSDIENSYLRNVMSKVRNWYIAEHGVPEDDAKKLKEPDLNKLRGYLDSIANEIGVDLNGAIPFVRSIDWKLYSDIADDIREEIQI